MVSRAEKQGRKQAALKERLRRKHEARAVITSNFRGFFIKWGIIAIIFLVVFLGIRNYAWGSIVEITEPAVSKAEDLYVDIGRKIGSELFETGKVWTGEKEIFTLESETETNVKTGIELDEFKPYGLEFGEFGENFGVRADVLVHKFDERIKTVNAFVSCSLYPDYDIERIIPGEIESDYPGDKEGDRYKLEIDNSKIGEKINIPVDCVFSDKSIIKGTIKFELSYSIPVEAYLDVFVLNKDFSSYYGSDSAFQDLNEGEYKSKKQILPSVIKYKSDVEAIINFASQPLAIYRDGTLGRDYTLAFQFKNNDIKNKVDFKGFDFKLPVGMSFNDCEFLDIRGREATFSSNYFKTAEDQLNNDDGLTEVFKCKVHVDETMLGDDLSDIVDAGRIVGNLSYDYVLKKNADIELT